MSLDRCPAKADTGRGKEWIVGHRLCLGVVCLSLALASCSTGEEVSSPTTDTDAPNPTVASSTIPPPDPPAPSTTPTTTDPPATSTTTPASPAGFVPPRPFVAPAPAPSGGGSGCSPGAGPLPDGVWFGFIDDMAPDSIDFDLACFVSCEVGEGFSIRNDNPTSRTVDVKPDALVVFANPDGDDWLESFDAFQSYEEAALHNDVWIYVNDGIVTHIANAAAGRGCRSSAVDVEWMAQHPMAIGVAFNDLGLIAVAGDPSGDNRFYWRSDNWTTSDWLARDTGWVAAASGDTVAFGASVHRWSGSSWVSEIFDALGEGVQVLDMSGDRVLMAGTSGDQAQVYVLTRFGDSWDVATIPIGQIDEWSTRAGTISGSTFAVADTGMDTTDGGRGTVHIYDFDGASWTRTATIPDPWHRNDWGGNWGSSIDLEAGLLVVGADGATPGPGTSGAIYAYVRTSSGWEAELVGEGGEGFGVDVHTDGSTIVAGGAGSDPEATFWVFTAADPGWLGTPVPVPVDEENVAGPWALGVDVDDDLVAVATYAGLWIGRIVPVG